MTDQDQIKLYKDQIERTIDINRVISVVIRRWYVILTCIVVALAVAYIQLRYTKPLYTATLQIKVEDDKGNQVGDLFRYGRISGRIENQLKTESQIFKSRTLGIHTLKNLGYDIAYFQKGQIVTSELYPFPYFKITPLYLDSADYGASYSIKFIDDQTFALKKGEQQLGKSQKTKDSLILEIGRAHV
jgi:uncharacterized protein involved in exopolysaccharide biosynthesis